MTEQIETTRFWDKCNECERWQQRFWCAALVAVCGWTLLIVVFLMSIYE